MIRSDGELILGNLAGGRDARIVESEAGRVQAVAYVIVVGIGQQFENFSHLRIDPYAAWIIAHNVE